MQEHQHRERANSAFILDDNPKVGELVSKLLGMIGIDSRRFVEPGEFLIELQRSPPPLVVLDLALGRSDAVEVIRELEVLQFKGKVLLISGRGEATLSEIEEIGRARGLHMLHSLQKPFRALDLKTRLDVATASSTSSPHNDRSRPDGFLLDPPCGLSDALRKNWLEVWYQPKIDLKSLSVIGAEALVRLRHPDYGLLAPASFLPESGDPLYRPLTAFVMHRAMKDWALFDEYGFPIKLSVNVPASLLSRRDFVRTVRQTIPRHSDFPGLILEVTEDEAIRDSRLMHEVVVQLRIYNASVAIDDFGSAYSSLARLKDIPFSELKLDRGFVTDCSSDPASALFARQSLTLVTRSTCLSVPKGWRTPRTFDA
ncbi:MAG: EAL domain-containing response regulator [Xanthobacteraceae bacterium]|nr:EAL domain-containing response regulator [Xanthobacteraceae bacterium]